MNKTIVIKIGGSLLFSEDKKIDTGRISKFCDIILENNSFDTVVIICGGGLIARDFIDAVRLFSENEAWCDLMGIELSRLNSRLLLAYFKKAAYPLVPKSIEELSTAQLTNKIIVMGGLQPGQSTTSVAIEVAEYLNAENILVLTDVDGIYDKDPKKHKNAKLLEKITYRELQELILNNFGDSQASAGEYRIFDLVSLQLLKRSKLTLKLLSGRHLERFEEFWSGKKDVLGTLILP